MRNDQPETNIYGDATPRSEFEEAAIFEAWAAEDSRLWAYSNVPETLAEGIRDERTRASARVEKMILATPSQSAVAGRVKAEILLRNARDFSPEQVLPLESIVQALRNVAPKDDQDTSTLRPAAETESLVRTWARAATLRQDLDGAGGAGATDTDFNRLSQLEDLVLEGAIRSTGDAVAKLKALAINLDRGPRDDGADCEALGDVISWLESTAIAATLL